MTETAPFYNTTHLRGNDLAHSTARAATQDQLVLAFFRSRGGASFTRDEVHELVLPAAQNTSITRALNTLMKLGHLEKLTQTRAGKMGAAQHLWRYTPKQERLL